ncbi:MAG: hypothetical protein KAI15_06180, partial [Gammaproteobacteria bacterium]|nr:hypothetical protein [Gammaproteobacteria bacterium]
LKDKDPVNAEHSGPMLGLASTISPTIAPFGKLFARILRAGSFVSAMGKDNQDGVVRYRSGRLKIHYEPSNSPIFGQIEAVFRTISEKTRRRIYYFKRPITTHPTGGACIGRSRDEGVVNSFGEVFDHPGLYIADSAVLPKSLGGPASLTIAAWSEHVSGHLLDELERQ